MFLCSYDISMTFRERTIQTNIDIISKPTSYAADTEFVTGKGNIPSAVYDVAFVDIYNPYRSISSILDLDDDISMPSEKLIKAQLTRDIYERIKSPPSKVEALVRADSDLYYFWEPTDYKWMRDTNVFANIYDVANLAAKTMKERGITMSDSNSFDMTALYGEIVGPCDKNLQHRAITDAVMLAATIRITDAFRRD